MPLKCGRFARFLKKRVCRVTSSILIGAPRYRCTKNKRNLLSNDDVPSPKKRKVNVGANVLNVYEVMKKKNPTKAQNVDGVLVVTHIFTKYEVCFLLQQQQYIKLVR